MKVLLFFSVSFSFALVQNLDARPYPENSTVSYYFGNWFGYGENTTIAREGAALLAEGATQVLESASEYGKMGVEMAGNLGQTALDAVNTVNIQNIAEMGTNAISSVANSASTLCQELITRVIEIVKSVIDAKLAIINLVIQGIQNLASAIGDFFPF